MGKHRLQKFIFMFAILLVVLACEIPLLTAPTAPDVASDSVETIIAGTAAAARTQTAVFMPTPTLTATIPPLPTATITETLVPTATVIFIIPTATEEFVPSSAGNGCELIAIEPYNPIVDPGESFDTTWTLKNSGSEFWDEENIDFKHTGGTDMHKNDIYDLAYSVTPGSSVLMTVSMIAPKKSGTYTTTWELASGKKNYCKVSTQVIVR